MIAEKLTEPVFWALAAAAILNIMQRRHHKHCVKKRTSTLIWAVLIFAFYVVVIVVASNEGLSDYFLLAGVAIVAVAAYILREKAIPYKIKCVSCGERMSFERIMYYDSNMCEKCDPPVEEEEPKPGFLQKFMKPAEEPQAEPEKPVVVPDTVEEVDWDSWKFTEQAVICYIKDNDKNQVLLINKKTGLGAGKVNAPGGRIEPGEMPLEAVVRECQEEVGLTPADPKHVGDLFFIFKNGHSLRGFVYTAEAFSGDMIETDEAEPFWCDRERIPYDKMWADDALWLEKALNDIKISGRFIFDDDEMLSHDLEIDE
ncbi:MAG: 8-oxo-dGTP diphosphatase [Spirochaetales bacterium]|uniref:Oxidized purine nucleoside triphosphate hydrolase n=1 Tax=Candidatus Thalassospirochaeta sargassi TaxID=3119039 RepID=A0AAJ1IBW1_9SPIO|nr:8-oxo-dGTP diphosphatase [Spirochaetales bacterium]